MPHTHRITPSRRGGCSPPARSAAGDGTDAVLLPSECSHPWCPCLTRVFTPACLQYKLCRVKKQSVGKGGIPYIVTHDGRTIRYPDPDIKVRAHSSQPACAAWVGLTCTEVLALCDFAIGCCPGALEGSHWTATGCLAAFLVPSATLATWWSTDVAVTRR